MSTTIAEDEVLIVAHRWVVVVGVFVGVLLMLAICAMAWVTAASLHRQAELLQALEDSRQVATDCEYQAITGAFERAAAALEVHQYGPRGR